MERLSIDTSNKFLVSGSGSEIRVIGALRFASRPLSREEAVNLAAWLVAIADPSRTMFDDVFSRIMIS